jgi:ComF family protein
MGCGQCAELSFLFGRNVSLGVFDGVLRRLIHLYKFEGRRSLHRFFATRLFIHNRSYINGADCIVPVPLSRTRYAERGFNQSYLLARSVARHAGVDFLGSALCRKGNAAPQSSVSSQQERITNLTDHFTVRAGFADSIRGRRVLLIDDVLTTGVTASACARALFESGAHSVDVLTIARSLKTAGTLYLSSNRPIMK